MLVEYIIEKALDKAYELIRLGYRKLDTDQTFLIAFENALAAYKCEFLEDELYTQFYKEDTMYYCDIIKDIIDNTPSTRELESNLVYKIIELLPNCPIANINIFITQLFTELFFTDEYKNKILEYRRDDEIGKIYKVLLELKEAINGKQSIKVKFANNMFQYYLDKWNGNLFLHKNTENKIHLKDLYVLPFYKERNSGNRDGIRKDLDEKIDMFLRDSVIGNRRKPMIILADAGMGKSSLVSYICSKCPQKDNLIILKFADLHSDSLEANILSSILHELNCEIGDLRNKRLIIDGFDESEFTSDKNRLLSNFFNKCQSIQGLKVLVTSRVNYVDCMKFTSSKLYYLQFMNEVQIVRMSRTYFDLSNEEPYSINNIIDNEVIGVPLILYMTLSLKIHIEEGTGICELYEKIFAFDGGIYDRMTMNDSDGYTEEVHPIAYYDVKQEVHLISQLIAFSMFETSSLILASDKYLKIVKSVSEDRVGDFAVSNYYYIESSTYTLSFCHKSIYEYFVAEYIHNTISNYHKTETIAKKLAYLFKKNLLTEEILHFLKFKIERNCQNDENTYLLMESVVNLMIQNGMTYYLEEKVVDILKTESIIFLNIFLVLESYYVGIKYRHKKNIKISDQFLSQLNNRFESVVNLEKTFLKDLKLNRKRFLTNLDLCNSILESINFEDSDLSFSLLKNTELKNISFNQVIMNGVIFNDSTLLDTNIRYARLRDCKFVSCILVNFWGSATVFENCSFENARITNADFTNSDLSNAIFKKAILSNIKFGGTVLNNVDFCGTDLTGINLHLAQQTNSIKIDNKSIFNYATVDSTFVPKLLRCNSKNLKGLKIYDVKKNEEISLEEYKKRYIND